MSSPKELIDFWLEHGPEKWFSKVPAFDAEIAERYHDLHLRASRRELSDWEETAEGALGLLLLLDQFPRNLFRGSAHSYACDSLARKIARDALGRRFDQQIAVELRSFFYLPFEHSEDMADQDLCVSLCERLRDETGDGETLKWALVHRDIIARFGRFPHRNEALGRDTTPEEQAFLDADGFKG